MAKNKTETRSIVNQIVFVNVIIDGENEPFSMQYSNEHSAEKVHHVLSTMIEDPIEESTTLDVSTSAPSIPDEIRKYKELLDDGIITQEEFNTKKKQLLGL